MAVLEGHPSLSTNYLEKYGSEPLKTKKETTPKLVLLLLFFACLSVRHSIYISASYSLREYCVPSDQMSTKSTNKEETNEAEDRLSILLPNALRNQGECTLLVQIDPKDSSTLDFEGATGAIGRIEADPSEGEWR